jgi:hypothetical protein
VSRLVVRILGFDIFEVSTEVEEVEVEEEEPAKAPAFEQPGGMGGVDCTALEVGPAPLGFGSRHPEPLPTFDPWPEDRSR